MYNRRNSKKSADSLPVFLPPFGEAEVLTQELSLILIFR
ncbi:hypothetical protein GPEL0_01f1744 [Geoanaerobacter pelophilus]|uniref:Uncharacterized protein n=1 Tax=Geoanaerobacter pelophilus TaxID=60036 RepID=A0ABQ0MH21_9BACT|nr:hypothetical protein GPEL0_01f1744 [Geoanaerobacter pelophilus]